MATTDGRQTPADGADDEQATVTVHQCSEDRVVFVEEDNADAWIATDLTVGPSE
jgi:hypothetical protein